MWSGDISGRVESSELQGVRSWLVLSRIFQLDVCGWFCCLSSGTVLREFVVGAVGLRTRHVWTIFAAIFVFIMSCEVPVWIVRHNRTFSLSCGLLLFWE